MLYIFMLYIIYYILYYIFIYYIIYYILYIIYFMLYILCYIFYIIYYILYIIYYILYYLLYIIYYIFYVIYYILYYILYIYIICIICIYCKLLGPSWRFSIHPFRQQKKWLPWAEQWELSQDNMDVELHRSFIFNLYWCVIFNVYVIFMTPSGLSMLLVIDHVWLCLLIIINGEDLQYIPIVVKSTSKTVGVNLDSIAVCHYPVLLVDPRVPSK